jgi:putative ABC transport system substrate-binding protein
LRRPEIALLALAALLLALPPAEGESGRVFRVGLLWPAFVPESIDVFVDELRQLGYEEGRNLVLDRRVVETAEQNAALAAELITLKPDVLVGSGPNQAMALKRATASIPIVLASVSDPVGLGIVDSLPRPGGNVTGVANYNPELAGKRLEMISESVPGSARIAILFSPANPAGVAQLQETVAAAATRSLVLVPAPARSAEEVPGALRRVVEEKADALIVLAQVQISTAYAGIIEFAVQNRLPTIFPFARWVRAGGLMSYGVDPGDSSRRAAAYVDKILKGAKPADLPVENPTRFELVVNLKTAKALGLTIPPLILARADEVIE